MHRKRRSNRVVQPRRLDQPTVVFGYSQSGPDWHNWAFRTMSIRKAQEMVSAKEAEIITRKTRNGVVQFYRETQPVRASNPTPCSLTMATTKAVGQEALGCRLSAGEAAQIIKFRVWPLIGDTKAIAVRPRQTEAEKAIAVRLLNGAIGLKGEHVKVHQAQRSEVSALYFDDPAVMHQASGMTA